MVLIINYTCIHEHKFSGFCTCWWKNTQIALSLNVLLYIILKIKLKFQCSNIAGKLQIPYYIFYLKDQKWQICNFILLKNL